MTSVCYSDQADKAARYVRETIPLIFQRAQTGPRLDWQTLAKLHEYIRAQRYLPEFEPCDDVQSTFDTLAYGGDCEDWAAVLLNQLAQRGVQAELVTAGDLEDNFRHVYVRAFSEGRWWTLDPKGSQRGDGFDREPGFAIKRYWTPSGEVGAVSGSGAVRDGYDSGDRIVTNDDILFASSAEFGPWSEAHPEAAALILAEKAARERAAAGLPPVSWTGDAKTVAANMQQAQQQYQAALEVERAKAAPVDTSRPYMPMRPATPTPQPTTDTRDALTKDNDAVAAWFASGVPREVLGELVSKLDIRTDVSEADQRKALAQYIALEATWQKTSLRKVLADAGVQVPQGSGCCGGGDGRGDGEGSGCDCGPAMGSGQAVQGSGANFFDKFGKSMTKLVKRPADFFQSATEEIGKGLSGLGQLVLKLEDKVPWLAQYVTKPLFIHGTAVVFDETGKALIDHSVASFDETRLMRAGATTLTAHGQSLIVAGGFLPPPWGPAAIAIGTAMVAGGMAINAAVDLHEYKEAYHAGKLDQSWYVDELGRRVDAQGNLLDPLQAVKEAERQAAQPPQQNFIVAPGRVKIPPQADVQLTSIEQGVWLGDLKYDDFSAPTAFVWDGARAQPLARVVLYGGQWAWQAVEE